jgi:hypothetical protein
MREVVTVLRSCVHAGASMVLRSSFHTVADGVADVDVAVDFAEVADDDAVVDADSMTAPFVWYDPLTWTLVAEVVPMVDWSIPVMETS